MLPSAPPPLPSPAPRSWFRRQLFDPFLGLLRSGLSPAQLALTVALGMALGVAPLFGLTTLLCAAVALRLRLNVAAMQLAAHLMTAFQVALAIPLLRAGAMLMGQGHAVENLSLASTHRLIDQQGWGAVARLLWRAELGALLIWAMVSAPVVAGLYFGLRVVFRRMLGKQSVTANAAKAPAA